MSTPKPLICLLAATLSLTVGAWAGDSRNSTSALSYADRENPWTAMAWHTHTRREIHPHALRVAAAPVIFLGRIAETFQHFPQIISETMQGDRALVNKRGPLGPREVPAEDTVYSPDE